MRFSALGENTAPAAEDIFPTTDISDGSKDKKVQFGTFAEWIANQYTSAAQRGYLPSEDLNNIETSGVYVLTSGNSYTNCPTAFGVLEVLAPSASQIVQRIGYSGGVYWVRFKGTSWGPWYKQDRCIAPGTNVRLVRERIVCAAYSQDSSKAIIFTVPCARSLELINTLTITALGGLTIRPINGGSIYYGSTPMGSLSLADIPAGVTINASKGGDGCVNIALTGENAFVTVSGGSTAIPNFAMYTAVLSNLSVDAAE